MEDNDTLPNIDEMKQKSEAWDIAYPAILFLIEAGSLPPLGFDSLRRAVKHFNQQN